MHLLMFKSIHGMATHYLTNKITMKIEIADRNTRSLNENDVYVPCANLESFKNSFAFRGPSLWNMLPDNIKECHKIETFKYMLKHHIKHGNV